MFVFLFVYQGKNQRLQMNFHIISTIILFFGAIIFKIEETNILPQYDSNYQ